MAKKLQLLGVKFPSKLSDLENDIFTEEMATAEKVRTAQTTAENAQIAADNAQNTANTAVTKADNAQNTADKKMNSTNPSGTGSFSMNRKANSTVGYHSYAEGTNTTASGTDSHSEGSNSVASGYGAHAEGMDTVASGSYSHAEGVGNSAIGVGAHSQGKYCVADDDYAHIVGNGSSNTKRSNAHTIDWNGVGWFQGGLRIGGKNQNDGAKSVLLEGDAISTPVFGRVGQVLVVKTVDKNNKPVEWEVVNAPEDTGGGGYTDLTGYATEQWVQDGYQPKGDYLEEDELSEAIDTALAQAKESGQFDGKNGESGVYILTDGETISDVPDYVNVVIDQDGEPIDVLTAEQVSSLIDEKLGVIENGSY